MLVTRLVIFGLLTLLIGITTCSKHPHIIMIVADDLGFNDVSFHGCPQIPTPNIDKLANEGIILNNYYVLPNCSPTRSALLTGRYPINIGMQSGTVYGANAWGIGLKEKLLPQYLKKAGYKTHAIGKWHLGFAYREYTPTQRGFDSFYGLYGGQGDYWDHSFASNGYFGLDLHDDTPKASKTVWNQWGNYSSKMFSMEAVDRINGHNKKDPLFLYLSYQGVHSANLIEDPLQAPQKWINKFQDIKHKGRRKYAAMVAAMDHGIGMVYKTLKKRKMLDDSIIIFTSDNGGPANGLNMNWATNYPLRGAKTTVFEGGVKAAGFIYTKLLTNPRVSYDLMHATDWLPTLLNLIGEGDQVKEKKLDGFDMWKTFQYGESSPRTEVLINIDPLVYKNAALRIGDWKIVNQSRFYDGWYKPPGLKDMKKRYLKKLRKSNKSDKNLSSFWVGQSEARVKCGPVPKRVSHCGGKRYKPCLFNLKDDPCEFHDLSERFPIIYEIMLRRLNEYRKNMAKPRMVTYRDPEANPKKRNGVWLPWKIHPKNKQKENAGSFFGGLFSKFPYSFTCGLARK